MKRKIKVGFCDYWPWHNPLEDPCYKVLAKRYDVELSDNPDYLFFSEHGRRHERYSCIKIFVTAEAVVPDFNLSDYAIGFDDLSFGDRYCRAPHWLWYDEATNLSVSCRRTDEELLNRKFCSIVVSNGLRTDPIRERFFRRLSEYKTVDAGGRLYNNVGGPVANKLKFCARYKFNLAFENVRSPGYVTEKIFQAYAADTLPIYFGAPDIEAECRPETFVRVSDESDMDRAIEEIIRLDRQDDEYLRRMRQPRLVHPVCERLAELERFLVRIVEQPIERAGRLIPYGAQAYYRKEHTELHWIGAKLDAVRAFYGRLKGLVGGSHG